MNFLQLPECVLVHASKLSGLQLAILADAWTWEKQGKEARRSNDQLAEMFGATTRGISKAVKSLQELGLVELRYGANNIRHIKPRTVVHLNTRSPRTVVHPERSFHAATNSRSGGDEQSFHASPERSFTLIEHRVEQEVKQEVEQAPKKKKEEVVMPWETEAFRAAWTQWKDYKKSQFRFTFKSISTEQVSLHQLKTISNNDERTAIDIIGQSIGNGWKGFFTLKNGGRNRQDAKLDANKALEWANK